MPYFIKINCKITINNLEKNKSYNYLMLVLISPMKPVAYRENNGTYPAMKHNLPG